MIRSGLTILLLFVLHCCAFAQGPCTTLGQTPMSAFPVCATTSFQQKTVPECVNGVLPTNCTSGGLVYEDLNPYWYKFTCYKAGTLAIRIIPNSLSDDYDWQLFDITGRSPMDVYTDKSLIVSYNWSGEPGITGTSPTGTNQFNCGSTGSGPAVPLFSTMPTLIEGHEYLLMISHFSGDNQSGYSLSFPTGGADGGTALIVDPESPKLKGAYGVCDGTEIKLVLDRKINCGTIAADGSDFSVTGPIPLSILSAKGNGCANSFDSDTIVLRLSSPMILGDYTVTAKTGSDGNTVGKTCGPELVAGEKALFHFIPGIPTPMDSVTRVVCIQDSIELVFRKPIQCSSISPDGSDFEITGPVPVTIRAAKGVCSDGVSTYIRLLLSKPIRVNGTFTVTLRNGSDGNTLLDECAEVTPAGSSVSFTTHNIVTADFNAMVGAGCRYDTLQLTHDGNNLASVWQWKLNGNIYSTARNTSLITRDFGDYTVGLKVSNGFCMDSISQDINLPDHTVKAAFAAADTLCPEDPLIVTDQSSSNAISWRWNFGNGSQETTRSVSPQYYPQNGRPSQYMISLEVSNAHQCTDIAYKPVHVLASCYIAVPSAFTPNGDGLNDHLYPLNAFKATDIQFRVYNRSGQVLFESRHWSGKWDGRYKGNLQPSGTYVWTFSYTNPDNGERVNLKGTTVLIR